MGDNIELRKIGPDTTPDSYSSQNIQSGIPVTKPMRIQLYSPSEWEEFTEEWATSLDEDYHKIQRFAGSGDNGLDVVGFLRSSQFEDGWDNYQCKHYDHPLTPSDVTIEIGKIIYYSFTEVYPPPKKYYFVAPEGIGTKLSKLLADFQKLKKDTRDNWNIRCKNKITTGRNISLRNEFLRYFNAFDFSIFDSVSSVKMIEDHSKTVYHTVRFGGGLPKRGKPNTPPNVIKTSESRYVSQLLEAYSDNSGKKYSDIDSLDKEYKEDFDLQRERFYHAESLRNFSRDTVPEGTFDSLKDEIFQGVIDVCRAPYQDGYKKMRETLSQSAKLSLSQNPLITVTKIQDKQGICHHLANEDKINWV